MWVRYNANPEGKSVGDCVIRALSKALGVSWESIFIDLSSYGLTMHDLPSANSVWGAYLRDKGYSRHIIPDTCPDCYSVAQFAEDHPQGKYILALTGHVVAVSDGQYFDTWDSGKEVPVYYWRKRNV